MFFFSVFFFHKQQFLILIKLNLSGLFFFNLLWVVFSESQYILPPTKKKISKNLECLSIPNFTALMWKVDNYSSQPSAHWAFVGSMWKLVQWDYHLFFFFFSWETLSWIVPSSGNSKRYKNQVQNKIKDRTCQTRRLHFRTPHWVHTNSSTVVSWDSQTVKPNGWLFLSLTQPLCSTLSGLLLSENTFTLGFMTPSSPGFTATSLGFPPIPLFPWPLHWAGMLDMVLGYTFFSIHTPKWEISSKFMASANTYSPGNS